MTYIQWFGSFAKPRGHLVPETGGAYPAVSPAERIRELGCGPGSCGPALGGAKAAVPLRWSHTVTGTLLQHVSRLRPTLVLVNVGLWRFKPKKFQWKELERAKAVLEREGSLVMWKTTNPTAKQIRSCKGGAAKGAVLPNQYGKARPWAVFDVFNIICRLRAEGRKVFQEDGRHLLGSANQALNRALIRLIANQSIRPRDLISNAKEQLR